MTAAKCHRIVADAIVAGILPIPSHCADCGTAAAYPDGLAYHHSDYMRPTDVVAVCPPCHAARHRQRRSMPRRTRTLLIYPDVDKMLRSIAEATGRTVDDAIETLIVGDFRRRTIANLRRSPNAD